MGVRGFFPFHVSVGVEFADRVLWLWELGRGAVSFIVADLRTHVGPESSVP